MKCVHGREVGGFYGGECSECEEEKRRHREVIDHQEQALAEQERAIAEQRRHHEELLEAQQRQQEILQEAALSQERAARAQRERLDLQKQQLATEKARQQTEEERLELRTGLPEFAEPYRRLWQQLSEANEARRTNDSELQAERQRLLVEKENLSKAVQSDWDQIHADLAKDLQSQLTQGRPRMKDPPAVLDEPSPREQLAALSSALDMLAHRVGASRPKILESDGPLVRVYRHLGVLMERLDNLSSRSLPEVSFSLVLCSALLLLCLSIAITFALYDPKATGTALVFALALFVPVLLATRRIRLRRRLAAVCAPTQDCLKTLMSLLALWPDLEFKPLLPWAAETESLKRRVANAVENSKIVCHNTILALLDSYRLDNFELHSRTQQLSARNVEVGRKDRRLEEIAESLEYSPQEKKNSDYFRGLRAEIRRVGRLILDGRRLPGAQLELLQCASCGGPVGSEVRKCPYCEGSLG